MKGKIADFLKKFFDKQLWKFLLVGIINTLVGATVMFVLYNVFEVNYWISSASNYIVGSIVSFFLNKFFTFQSKKYSLAETVRFIVNILICYLIAYGGAKQLALYIFSQYSATVQTNVAMIIGMVVFVGLNYIGQRFFVFRKWGKDKTIEQTERDAEEASDSKEETQ